MDSVLKTWGLVLLCIALMTVAVFAFVNPKKQRLKPTTDNPTPKAQVLTTTLSLNPENISVNKGSTANLTIGIDTTEDLVSAVEVILQYDPSIITIEDAAASDFYDRPAVLQETINNETGELTLAIGNPTAKSGKGKLATIKIKGKKSGSSPLDLTQSEVAAIEKTGSVLKTPVVGKVNVK